MNNLLASSCRSVVQGSYCVTLGYLWLIKKQPYVIQNKCYWALSNLWTTRDCTVIRAVEIGHKNEVTERKKRSRVPPRSIFPIPRLKATSFPGPLRRDVKVGCICGRHHYLQTKFLLTNQICNEWIKQNNPAISGLGRKLTLFPFLDRKIWQVYFGSLRFAPRTPRELAGRLWF